MNIGLLTYGVFWLVLLLAPGLLVGASRSSQHILGKSSSCLLDDSEEASMGSLPLLFFAAGIAYTLGAVILVILFEEEESLLVQGLVHALVIGLNLIHVGLIKRNTQSKQRFLEVVTPLYGLMLGGVLGWEMDTLLEKVSLIGWFGLGGYLLGTTAGRYTDGITGKRKPLSRRAILGGLVGGIAAGVLGCMAGIDSYGGIEDSFVLGMMVGGWVGACLGGLSGALFSGLARPEPLTHASTIAPRKHRIFPLTSLAIFLLEIILLSFIVRMDGETFWIPGSLLGIAVGTIAGGLTGAISGGIAGSLVSWASCFSLFFTRSIARKAEQIFTPPLIRFSHKACICQHCLSYSFPFKAAYKSGKRSCEHCQKAIGSTTERGKVVVNFGDFPLKASGRVFILTNLDAGRFQHSIEISEVYLDTQTTDRRIFERFLTYLLNYPPTFGLRSVQFFYRGELDSLGTNLKNVLRNTFPLLKALTEDESYSPPRPVQPASRIEKTTIFKKAFRRLKTFLPQSIRSGEHPALLLLHNRDRFWQQVKKNDNLSHTIFALLPCILFACVVYGTVLTGWRSAELSVYVAIKFPLLLLGTTAIVSIFNWMLASAFGSGLSFPQVTTLTYGAMTVASWILLALAPISLFFANSASLTTGSHAEIQRTHNFLLLTHITLIAIAGVAGNQALRKGLRKIAAPGCAIHTLYISWLAAFALVGCQLSWILRPFVGSPFYPVVFMRSDCLERNFYEFVFLEVLPYLINGG